MELSNADCEDIGLLVKFALQPRLYPGRDSEYRRTLARFNSDVKFADATTDVLRGLGTVVLEADEKGLVLGVEPESPFDFRLKDLNIPERNDRLLFVIIAVGIAAWAYPDTNDLDDPLPKRMELASFEEWLRGVCQQIAEQNDAGHLADADSLAEAWRLYLDMKSVDGDRDDSKKQRQSKNTTTYWVKRVANKFVDWGLAQDDSSSATDEAWHLTDRFRIAVRDMASEPAYELLAKISRQQGSTSEGASS